MEDKIQRPAPELCDSSVTRSERLQDSTLVKWSRYFHMDVREILSSVPIPKG